MSRFAAARFTPSLNDHETLEALFVAREGLLTLAMEKVADAADGRGLSHLLFVGPRGAGKTHLISLINYRAKQFPGFGTAFSVAWLPEDPWTIDSFEELVAAINESLDPPAAQLSEPRTRFHDAQHQGPIVVLAENFDQILSQIGTDGQRALRAMIENHRSLLLIATSTRLSRDLRNQAVPFYGFFDEINLEPFKVDDAAAMLQHLARANDDEALAEQLGTAESRVKLAAIQHLAGGQPRVWALLGNGLTVQGLQDLVSTMVGSLDDLTPYYQEQLARLSRNERRVVKALSDSPGSLNVKSAAAVTGIDQRSLSKTLTDLRRMGWVRPRTGYLASLIDRRMTYYDLAEPLVRIAFQMKEQRAQPIDFIINFVIGWYELVEIEKITNPPIIDLVPSSPGTASIRLSKALTAELIDDSVTLSKNVYNFLSRAVDGADLALLEQCDDALALLQHNADATLLLELPIGVSTLLESHLAAHSDLALNLAVARIRLSLGWLFVRTKSFVSNWRLRGQDAFKDGSVGNPNLIPLFLAETVADRPAAAAAVLEAILDGHGDRQAAILTAVNEKNKAVLAAIEESKRTLLARVDKLPYPHAAELAATISGVDPPFVLEAESPDDDRIRQSASRVWLLRTKVLILGIHFGLTVLQRTAAFDQVKSVLLSRWSEDPLARGELGEFLVEIQNKYTF